MSKNWWFDNSSPGHERGSVDIVLTAKVFNDDVGTIMVELWFRGKRGPRTATIRLKDGGHSPARGAQGNPDLWTWSGVPTASALRTREGGSGRGVRVSTGTQRLDAAAREAWIQMLWI